MSPLPSGIDFTVKAGEEHPGTSGAAGGEPGGRMDRVSDHDRWPSLPAALWILIVVSYRVAGRILKPVRKSTGGGHQRTNPGPRIPPHRQP